MDINAIGIPLTFLVLCAIGLWMIIFSKGFWAFKTLFITFCLYFSFAMWFSLSDLSGWATSVAMPQKSIIHWILVQEPSKFNKKDDGGIFVWATEADTENKVIEKSIIYLLKPFSIRKNSVEPRAYRLSYSEELHQNAAKAMQMIMSGKTIIGEKSGNGTGEAEALGKESHGESKGNGSGSLSQEQVFRFYELPPFKLPEKITGRSN
jgi:hypothetical protein